MPLTISHLLLHVSPQAVWAFGEHLGSNEPWTCQQGGEGGWCCLHFHLSGLLVSWPDSTSQPLLPQYPAFSLDFYLCSVVYVLSLSSPLSSLPSPHSLWSLPGLAEGQSED